MIIDVKFFLLEVYVHTCTHLKFGTTIFQSLIIRVINIINIYRFILYVLSKILTECSNEHSNSIRISEGRNYILRKQWNKTRVRKPLSNIDFVVSGN